MCSSLARCLSVQKHGLYEGGAQKLTRWRRQPCLPFWTSTSGGSKSTASPFPVLLCNVLVWFLTQGLACPLCVTHEWMYDSIFLLSSPAQAQEVGAQRHRALHKQVVHGTAAGSRPQRQCGTSRPGHGGKWALLGPHCEAESEGRMREQGGPEPYIYMYIRCTYGIYGRNITIQTVIYGVYIRFWPTLCVSDCDKCCCCKSIL